LRKELCQLSIKIKILVNIIFSNYDFYKTKNDIEITVARQFSHDNSATDNSAPRQFNLGLPPFAGAKTGQKKYKGPPFDI
jgi:hypothetical protein